ncbi:MAG TPA: tripartite tricarboxylate transporter substrate-binding protein, partial [Xanthobacteraceae bacterium]|nr:tripartite tricarboxylate transporter substrate-binding protein [Xanthobacteraceae bacterium]
MLVRIVAWIALPVAALLGAVPAPAQTYPARQIELVVPFVAGGTTDNIARMLAQRFSDRWRQTVVVTNRPGGGSTIGTHAVAKAPPDGHTLLVTTIGFAITPALQKLPYDAVNDFAPVSELASVPLVLVVHASVPAKTLADFIALAKSQPGGLDYASSGTGTSPHLAAEMFCAMAGVKLVHVPFKGNAEGLNAMLGGHVKVYFALVPAVLQHVRAGTLRAIAVTTETRLAAL